jgi:hypothetical protein
MWTKRLYGNPPKWHGEHTHTSMPIIINSENVRAITQSVENWKIEQNIIFINLSITLRSGIERLHDDGDREDERKKGGARPFNDFLREICHVRTIRADVSARIPS